MQLRSMKFHLLIFTLFNIPILRRKLTFQERNNVDFN